MIPLLNLRFNQYCVPLPHNPCVSTQKYLSTCFTFISILCMQGEVALAQRIMDKLLDLSIAQYAADAEAWLAQLHAQLLTGIAGTGGSGGMGMAGGGAGGGALLGGTKGAFGDRMSLTAGTASGNLFSLGGSAGAEAGAGIRTGRASSPRSLLVPGDFAAAAGGSGVTGGLLGSHPRRSSLMGLGAAGTTAGGSLWGLGAASSGRARDLSDPLTGMEKNVSVRI
jgi:hypothetical protein